MNLTEQQKTDVIAAIAVPGIIPKVAIGDWIISEGLQGQIEIPQIRKQILTSHHSDLMEAQVPKSINRFTEKFCSLTGATVAQCDTLLAALQDAEVLIEAKKTELGG